MALAIDQRPTGASKLAGTKFWHLRVGDLRIVYLIDVGERLVVVLKAARRSESTYRRIER
jgi:mRNA-degrading endonuclease RelE of RelBE toxin-antitoxin system